jgi:hypothetical protein
LSRGQCQLTTELEYSAVRRKRERDRERERERRKEREREREKRVVRNLPPLYTHVVLYQNRQFKPEREREREKEREEGDLGCCR